MKLFAISAICTLFTCSAFAGQYVGINAGVNNMIITKGSHDGLKVGCKAGFTYGVAFDSGFRTEFECTYTDNNFRTKYVADEKDVMVSKSYNNNHSWAYMVNSLYDLKQLAVMSVFPYAGVGVGYCQNTQHLKVKTDSYTHSFKAKDNTFAYQAIVGGKYAINDQYAAALEYHYFAGKEHAKDHSVGLHLIRNF